MCDIGLRQIFSLGRKPPPNFTLHSQATLLSDCVHPAQLPPAHRQALRDCHPLWCGVLGRLALAPVLSTSVPGCACYLSVAQAVPHPTSRAPRQAEPRFRAGLTPVRSPLLGRSLLISFPPLSDMLKFSGLSPLASSRRSQLLPWSEAHPPRGGHASSCLVCSSNALPSQTSTTPHERPSLLLLLLLVLLTGGTEGEEEGDWGAPSAGERKRGGTDRARVYCVCARPEEAKKGARYQGRPTKAQGRGRGRGEERRGGGRRCRRRGWRGGEGGVHAHA